MVETSRSHVLIVDDTEANLDVLVEALGDEYEVSVATDGESALVLIADEPPDLILLDIMMPGMDGYEVCGRLKADAATREIPVIFVTALGEVRDETRGFEVGAVDYIQKPVSIPIVRARVRTHLALRQARQKLQEQNRELVEIGKLREDVERISRHDLKQPLAAMIGMPKLISAFGAVNDEQADLLDRIEAAGYRMLNMINLSLDLYKMERGTYKLDPAPFDILSVVRKVVEEISSGSIGRGLQFSILVDGRPVGESDNVTVTGEELLCYTMLANIIKNAAEASRKGNTVTVALDCRDMNSIAIHNPGVVPEELRERFFEKYATSGKEGGTGLGTYSARLMAETQGATIEMVSSEEHGTTITFRFPAAHADADSS
jgi:signal transduction histidine kinase